LTVHEPVESAPLHFMEFPTKERQLDVVPIYYEQETVDSTQPLPEVLHPVKNASHS